MKIDNSEGIPVAVEVVDAVDVHDLELEKCYISSEERVIIQVMDNKSGFSYKAQFSTNTNPLFMDLNDIKKYAETALTSPSESLWVTIEEGNKLVLSLKINIAGSFTKVCSLSADLIQMPMTPDVTMARMMKEIQNLKNELRNIRESIEDTLIHIVDNGVSEFFSIPLGIRELSIGYREGRLHHFEYSCKEGETMRFFRIRSGKSHELKFDILKTLPRLKNVRITSDRESTNIVDEVFAHLPVCIEKLEVDGYYHHNTIHPLSRFAFLRELTVNSSVLENLDYMGSFPKLKVLKINCPKLTNKAAIHEYCLREGILLKVT